MADFEQRLAKAIQRGHRASDARARAEAEKALGEQELQRLHTQYRLELSEHIETALRKLAQHMPGFQFESVVNDRGWGAAVRRDDFGGGSKRGRTDYFSRLEILVRPLSEYFLLELVAKGTVLNKELLNRSHYERLTEVDAASFHEMVDRWTLEFAELFSAKR